MFCAFVLTMFLVAVGLSALAMYLTTKVQSTKSSADGSSAGDNLRSMFASSTSEVVGNAKPRSASNAKISEVAVPPPTSRLPYPNGPKTDAKYAKDRVYCMVPFIWNKEIYDVIMNTWGKRCNVINFLTDSEVMADGKLRGDEIMADQAKGFMHHSKFPEGTFPDNVHFITMTRPWHGCTHRKTGKPTVCRHIWEKMWQSWIYVADHHLNQADWFCKVDYDTFFFPENLQYYVRDVKGWDAYNEHHYFGLLLGHKPFAPNMIAGAAACWSHKTLEAIADVYRKMPKGRTQKHRNKCEDRPEASEEISTSLCLYEKLNVTAESMVDDEMRQYIMVDPYHNMLTWNRTEQGEWWYWKNKPKGTGEMEDCCARRPMGIHKYKSKEKIESLDIQFYGLPDNKELTRLNERTRRYAEKVRTELGIVY